MAFIVPGVCRYTLHGTYAGRNVANVLDFFIDTTGSPANRAEACFDMAGIVINEWSDSMLPGINNGVQYTKVTWVDLDEEDGSTGERNSTSAQTWPKAGSSAGTSMPGNVAYLVRKVISRKRGARTGRIYVPGVIEADTATGTVNTLQSSIVTAWQTRMNSMLGDMNQTGGPTLPGGAETWMVVTHILTREPPRLVDNDGNVVIPGDPLTGEGLKVTNLIIDATLATQRRRLR